MKSMYTVREAAKKYGVLIKDLAYWVSRGYLEVQYYKDFNSPAQKYPLILESNWNIFEKDFLETIGVSRKKKREIYLKKTFNSIDDVEEYLHLGVKDLNSISKYEEIAYNIKNGIVCDLDYRILRLHSFSDEYKTRVQKSNYLGGSKKILTIPDYHANILPRVCNVRGLIKKYGLMGSSVKSWGLTKKLKSFKFRHASKGGVIYPLVYFEDDIGQFIEKYPKLVKYSRDRKSKLFDQKIFNSNEVESLLNLRPHALNDNSYSLSNFIRIHNTDMSRISKDVIREFVESKVYRDYINHLKIIASDVIDVFDVEDYFKKEFENFMWIESSIEVSAVDGSKAIPEVKKRVKDDQITTFDADKILCYTILGAAKKYDLMPEFFATACSRQIIKYKIIQTNPKFVGRRYMISTDIENLLGSYPDLVSTYKFKRINILNQPFLRLSGMSKISGIYTYTISNLFKKRIFKYDNDIRETVTQGNAAIIMNSKEFKALYQKEQDAYSIFVSRIYYNTGGENFENLDGYTITTASKMLNTSDACIREYIRQGKLKSKIHKTYFGYDLTLIEKWSLDKFIQEGRHKKIREFRKEKEEAERLVKVEEEKKIKKAEAKKERARIKKAEINVLSIISKEEKNKKMRLRRRVMKAEELSKVKEIENMINTKKEKLASNSVQILSKCSEDIKQSVISLIEAIDYPKDSDLNIQSNISFFVNLEKYIKDAIQSNNLYINTNKR